MWLEICYWQFCDLDILVNTTKTVWDIENHQFCSFIFAKISKKFHENHNFFQRYWCIYTGKDASRDAGGESSGCRDASVDTGGDASVDSGGDAGGDMPVRMSMEMMG